VAKIVVGNVKNGDQGEYIGRKCYDYDESPLANPFRESVYGREKCISMYRRWLWGKITSGDEEVTTELARLFQLSLQPEGVKLVCWCAPLPCHGDVIKSCLEWIQDSLEPYAVKTYQILEALSKEETCAVKSRSRR